MQFITNYIRKLKKNKKRSYALSLGERDVFFDKTPQLTAYRSISSSKGDSFNFNPIDESVSSFIEKILIAIIDKNKQDEFENKQRDIDSLSEERAEATDKEKKNQLGRKITDLRNELTAEKKLNEKIKFTFMGFDISKYPIPRELLRLSSDTAKNDCLASLLTGYIYAQILSLFKVTHAQFQEICIKKVSNRNPVEQAKYTKVSKLCEAVTNPARSMRNNSEPNINNEDLESIKKMGKEGKKMYALLAHLLEDASPQV